MSARSRIIWLAFETLAIRKTILGRTLVFHFTFKLGKGLLCRGLRPIRATAFDILKLAGFSIRLPGPLPRRRFPRTIFSAELVFGLSFYRQGTSGGTSSADEFIDEALAWFGDTDPRLGTAWEKGERLAKLVAPKSARPKRDESTSYRSTVRAGRRQHCCTRRECQAP